MIRGWAIVFLQKSVIWTHLSLFALIGLAPCGNAQTRTELRLHKLAAQWADAFRRQDARELASLEADHVEIVDRFGVSHPLANARDKEVLWAEGFEIIARDSIAPEFGTEQVHIVGSHIAIINVWVHFGDGIRLVDGALIPPHRENHSFLAMETRGRWLIASLCMHDETVSEEYVRLMPAR
jgi:hypothetical protein